MFTFFSHDSSVIRRTWVGTCVGVYSAFGALDFNRSHCCHQAENTAFPIHCASEFSYVSIPQSRDFSLDLKPPQFCFHHFRILVHWANATFCFRFLSTYTRRMLVVSQSGQFLMIEDNAAVTPTTPIYQVNLPGTSIMNVDLSRSMQAMVFCDSGRSLFS